eukprot:jgi/Bigna1/90470/estExt_fgenesh1_pg.C_710052
MKGSLLVWIMVVSVVACCLSLVCSRATTAENHDIAAILKVTSNKAPVFTLRHRGHLFQCKATSTDAATPVEEHGATTTTTTTTVKPLESILCCPVSFEPLTASNDGGGVRCLTTGLQYGTVEDTYLDLTPASGTLIAASGVASSQDKPTATNDQMQSQLPFDIYAVADTIEKVSQGRVRTGELLREGYSGDSMGLGTSTFRNPIVSQIYERGWRQSFARAGFPGPEKEFERAQKWLLPAAKNGILVDASCGSGLFTRKFVSSKDYQQVIALDFSESMLRETATLCKDNKLWEAGASVAASGGSVSPLLVRGDIGRLPFRSGAVDGLHAGAAIHCWPSPALALTEIARVLKPGGRAVLSTFMNPQLPFTDEKFRKAFFGQISQNSLIRAWEEGELKSLSQSVGLVNFECERNREFIIFKVEKPIL